MTVTVAELIAALQPYEDNAKVWIYNADTERLMVIRDFGSQKYITDVWVTDERETAAVIEAFDDGG